MEGCAGSPPHPRQSRGLDLVSHSKWLGVQIPPLKGGGSRRLLGDVLLRTDPQARQRNIPLYPLRRGNSSFAFAIKAVRRVKRRCMTQTFSSPPAQMGACLNEVSFTPGLAGLGPLKLPLLWDVKD